MAEPQKTLALFAVCAPGLEPFLAQELQQVGLSTRQSSRHPVKPSGGVIFSGDLQDLYRANLWLRCASRVLLRLGSFHATAFSELRAKAARLPWERCLEPSQPVALRVTCRKSRLYHSDAVAERIAAALGDRLGQRPSVAPFDEQGDDPLPQLIVVRLASDRCTISADSSGALLSKRGYRLAGARAPLRETLAAGMLMACGWEPASTLLDPFCGSGTIAIEAALLARRQPPGGARRFAFMRWPEYESRDWERLLDEARAQIHDRADMPAILASDRDAGAIENARANAARAGVAECIQISQRAVSAVEPIGKGWVITNPPYGRRLSADKDLRNLYAQLGNVLRAKCPGWQVGILCNDLRLLGQTQLKLDTSLSLDNGGLRVLLGRGIVP